MKFRIIQKKTLQSGQIILMTLRNEKMVPHNRTDKVYPFRQFSGAQNGEERSKFQRPAIGTGASSCAAAAAANKNTMLQHSLHYLQNPNPQLLLQPTLPNCFSNSSGHASPSTLLPLHTLRRSKPCLFRCSAFGERGTSKGYQRRKVIRWKDIYKRVALLENPETGVSSVLNQCEIEGKIFEKAELNMFVRNLRKFRRYKLALEVCEWMNARGERFKVSSSDMALMLDLTSKVHGVRNAEDFFTRLPDFQKDKRVYGALLNAYVEAKEKERAEFLMQKMIRDGSASYPLSFNVMMTLYMKLEEYYKVEMLISEMKRSNVRLDLYSYSIWLSARGSQGFVAGIEEVLKEMQGDRKIVPNWTTFSSVASWYIKLGELEKAKDYMKSLEREIDGQDREAYNYLLNLYGRVGDKEEVYRVWNVYKSQFQTITNWGYYSVLRSLVLVGDIEGAEKIYGEWLSVKLSYDARIGNVLLGWYVKEGNYEKVDSFFAHMEEAGAKPFASTWEILAEYNTKKRKIADALDLFKRAKSSGYWKPVPENASAFIKLCEEEGDDSSKEEMVALMKDMGLSEFENLMPLESSKSEQIKEGYSSDDIGLNGDGNSEMLFSVN